MLSVCGEMSRGFLNIADESEYLSEEEPTCKSQSFYYGLRYGIYVGVVSACDIEFYFIAEISVQRVSSCMYDKVCIL